jgi:glycerol-3-phosphate dehydrogenase (NAD(P)+)
MKITVLGAGAWGTALAKVLHENGNAVTLWDISVETLEELRHGRSRRIGSWKLNLTKQGADANVS